jgi:hypothetical protein
MRYTQARHVRCVQRFGWTETTVSCNNRFVDAASFGHAASRKDFIMSRFTYALVIGSSLALFGAGAPCALAQTAPAKPSITVSQMPAKASMPAIHAAACFSEDLVPQDNSSMLTICGAGAAPTVIFAQ